MQMTVYWDILWTVNFALDFILLTCTAFLTAQKISKLRIFVAAAFGATYALTPLFKNTSILYQPVIKIFIAFIMVAIAMKFATRLEYLKTTLLFFLVSFLAGGSALALNSIGEGLFVPVQTKAVVLIFTVLSLGLLIKTVYFRLRSLVMRGACKLTVRIQFGEKTSETNALLDTGNELACPFTGKPIIIINKEALQDILPRELANLDDYTQLANLSDEWKERLQILPYSALGNKGMLIAIRPDKAELSLKEARKFTEVHALVGLAKEDFCNDKSYKALVSSQLLPNIGGAVA